MPAETTPKLWTRDEFLKRFTDTERKALHRASLAKTATGDEVGLAFQNFYAKPYIASSSTTLASTLESLVQLGILTSERKTAILDPLL